MWKILTTDDTVEVDGRTYSVSGLQEGRVCVVPKAKRLSPNEEPPTYPILRPGLDVEIRKENQVRKARVAAHHGGMLILGPARMRDSKDGTDCPYCWFRDVPGEDTGTAVGFSSGSKLPSPIPVTTHKCPGCGMEWSSLEWTSLAISSS